MLIQKPLNLYFFKAVSIKDSSEILDFALQYDRDSLTEEIRTKAGIEDLVVEVLGEVGVKEILDIIDKDSLSIYMPRALKKREFIHNLMYTKDSLIKNEGDRQVLEKLLNSI